MDDLLQTRAPRLVPPAILPAERDPSFLILIARAMKNQIASWPRAMFEADAYRPPLHGMPLFVMHPAAVKTVMTDDVAFPQGHLFQRMMRPAWGKGLLTAEQEDWRAQRHAAAGAFRPAKMADFAPTFVRIAEIALSRWTASAGPTDIAAEMSRVTFDIIMETMLSGGEGFGGASPLAQVKDLESGLARMRLSYFLPDAYHAGRAEPLSAGGRALAADILAMVRRRRGEPEQGDLVDLLMKADFDDELLADNLRGFMVAGHDTTAIALTWTLYLVAAHPPTAARIRAEVDEVCGAGGLGPEQAQRLTFTRQVISEAMRLYPPAFNLTRVAQHDVELAGYRIKAGSRVNIPVYAIHRHRRLWSDPDAFDPDRFAPGAPPPDRYSYLPFGAGPRSCLGATFAMVEATTVLATLVRAAEFELVPGHEVKLMALVALRPEGGMPLRVRART